MVIVLELGLETLSEMLFPFFFWPSFLVGRFQRRHLAGAIKGFKGGSSNMKILIIIRRAEHRRVVATRTSTVIISKPTT